MVEDNIEDQVGLTEANAFEQKTSGVSVTGVNFKPQFCIPGANLC